MHMMENMFRVKPLHRPRILSFALMLLLLIPYSSGHCQDGFSDLHHQALLDKVHMCLDNRQYEAALLYGKALKKTACDHNSFEWKLKAIHVLIKTHQNIKSYDSALHYCYLGMQLSDSAKNNYDLARFKTKCAENYLFMNKPGLAINLLAESVETFSKLDSTEYYNYALGNLAIAYGMMDSLQKCESILQKIEHTQQSILVSHNYVATKFNLAIIFIQNQSPRKALRLLNQLSDTIKNNDKYKGRFELFKGQAYSQLRNDSARQYLHNAYRQAVRVEDAIMKKIATRELADFYKNNGNFQAASAFYQEHIHIVDSIETKKKQQPIGDMGIKFQIHQIEKEIEHLQKINGLSHQRLILLIILLLVTISIVLIIYLWMRSRIRFLKQTQTTLEKNLKSKKEVIQQSALNYAQVFAAIKSVLDLLKPAMGSGGQISFSNELNANISNGIKKLKIIVNEQKYIENQVDVSNAEFVYYLKKGCPELTVRECRLCALILNGLSSKEISSLLNISDKTINNARSVIRKKLKIPVNQSIQASLKNEYYRFASK